MKQIISLLTLCAIIHAQQVVLTLDAPAANITGLATSADALWAVSSSETTVYRLDPQTGAIVSSFSCKADDDKLVPTGLGYAKERVYVAQWTGIVNGACRAFQYMPSGEYKGKTVLSC